MQLAPVEEVEKHAIALRGLVYQRVPPTFFEDVMQDLKFALLVSLPKRNGDAKANTYAHAVCLKIIGEFWRREYRWRKAITELSGWKDHVFDYPQLRRINILTPIERRVLFMVAEGLNNEEIAAKMFRSVNTVRSHLKQIYKVLGSSDRAAIAVIGRKIKEMQ